ncbi:hypothetical protein C8N46_11318 [Kordia periserrulae]|uniref:TonB-dependent receptor-like protein n=1 Tax=Kordia periserrulae TaxID=701523 RepID=A0A2T6BR32_9FLAO|nr:hypothetical protein [Kordia periserrulae]PTX58528.1 hypothetical protein C8N46_11318 [Kordia periserrulae]
MKKIYYFVCILLCFGWNAFSQTTTVSERYQTHFKLSDQASVYLHLNKTSYLVGEEVWFKAYTFSRKDEKIAIYPTNLYVAIYDASGTEISKKLIRLQQGLGYGNFELDEKFNSGTYYIKAATQQMLDVQKKDAFIAEIVVYGKNKLADSQTTKAYDIQFLPEGGHLVKNIENTVAFKAINQEGKGVYVSGQIYDENNTEITTFEGNNYGIGTFQLTPKNNTNYKAKITFEEEKTSEQFLPKAKNTGIAIQVNAFEQDSIKISLQTNSETLSSIISKEYTLLIHKDGKARTLPFSFKDDKKALLRIPRNRLFHGVNTITLFDGKVPVLERMFFNQKVPKKLSVMVKKDTVENEYASFSVYLVKRKSGILDANVSISVLPATTEAYNPAHSIFSEFYLKPYVRGEIENPKYYFPNTTKTKREALDALLITQGWSAYDWTPIFEKAPKKSNTDRGITINGTLNFPVKRVKGLFLHDTKAQAAQFIPLNNERKFVIKNLYPQEGEALRFSAVGYNQTFIKPKLYLNYSANNEKETLPKNTKIDRSFLNKNTIFILPDGFFPKDAVDLDAVLLEGSNKKTKETRDPMMVNGKETKFGEKEYLQYPQVKDFIENSGYDVSDDPFDMQNLRIFTRKKLTLQAGNPPGYISPLIFVDGAPLTDFAMLRNFSSANVDRIIVNKTGQGYGVRGVGGVIKIFTRKNPLVVGENVPRESYVAYTPPIGFSVPKQYYEPKYQSYTDNTFQRFGAIDWRPNNTIPRRGALNFSVQHRNLKAIVMYIEGISKDGSLISEKRIIELVESD